MSLLSFNKNNTDKILENVRKWTYMRGISLNHSCSSLVQCSIYMHGLEKKYFSVTITVRPFASGNGLWNILPLGNILEEKIKAACNSWWFSDSQKKISLLLQWKRECAWSLIFHTQQEVLLKAYREVRFIKLQTSMKSGNMDHTTDYFNFLITINSCPFIALCCLKEQKQLRFPAYYHIKLRRSGPCDPKMNIHSYMYL